MEIVYTSNLSTFDKYNLEFMLLYSLPRNSNAVSYIIRCIKVDFNCTTCSYRHVTDNPTMKIRTSYKATVVIISVFTCSVVLLIGVYMRWHLELHLFWKDHFGKLEDGNINKHIFGCKIPLTICF